MSQTEDAVVVEETVKKRKATDTDGADLKRTKSGIIPPVRVNASETTINPPLKPTSYVLAVDLERTGPGFSYGIWEIGACFGLPDGTILDRAAFATNKTDIIDYDPDTWETFWKAMPEVRKAINAIAVPQHIRAFRDWLLQLEEMYGPFGKGYPTKLMLVSDNPAYDFGHIMVAFNNEGFERGVAEMFAGYVTTSDPSEQEHGLTNAEKSEASAFISATHTHDALDDATAIFQHYCGVKSVLAKRDVDGYPPPKPPPPPTPAASIFELVY
jgi:hypothetical protein